MTKDKWGPEIPVTITDGKRPDWLREDQVCCIKIRRDGEYIWHGSGSSLTVSGHVWSSNITAIKLLRDDPYYQTLQPDEPEVTFEALKAAAKYAGHTDPCNSASNAFHCPRNSVTLVTLAKMLMKHEPHLIEKSFEEQTAAEFYLIWANHKGLEQYQNFIKQHIKDAGK
jgi:hypothetical protein